MQNFRNLVVWKKAHQLTLEVYKSTTSFPAEERFGLTSQIRRCSASIGANIAEGCGRDGDGEFHRFLQMAMGSASELEYHLLLSHDLGLLSKPKYQLLEGLHRGGQANARKPDHTSQLCAFPCKRRGSLITGLAES